MSDVTIVSLRKNHRLAVSDIAGRCFKYSRFHLDPWISDSKANLVKRAWIENCCNGHRGKDVYTALINELPVGFLAVIESYEESVAGCIDLIGVAPEYQSGGVGTALLGHFVAHNEQDYTLLRVGTQIANKPSLALYQRYGFRVAGANYVLHAHIKEGSLITADQAFRHELG
jgi:ribosomal protein S18 acetylase RimI-like enzyme